MADAGFAYIWKYAIRPEHEDKFLAAYRPNGHWANLFARDPEYLRTDLLRDASDRYVYLTIDYWTSKAARDAFREKYSEEFSTLDRQCEEYTVSEVLIGDFFTHPA